MNIEHGFLKLSVNRTVLHAQVCCWGALALAKAPCPLRTLLACGDQRCLRQHCFTTASQQASACA